MKQEEEDDNLEAEKLYNDFADYIRNQEIDDNPDVVVDSRYEKTLAYVVTSLNRVSKTNSALHRVVAEFKEGTTLEGIPPKGSEHWTWEVKIPRKSARDREDDLDEMYPPYWEPRRMYYDPNAPKVINMAKYAVLLSIVVAGAALTTDWDQWRQLLVW